MAMSMKYPFLEIFSTGFLEFYAKITKKHLFSSQKAS
jgi:hypothetical protein